MNGGVVASVEVLTDLGKREVCYFTHDMHCDLTGERYVLDTLFTENIFFGNTELAAYFLEDLIEDNGDGLVFARYISYRAACDGN